MKHDRNSPEYQRAVDSFVRQNVHVCLSSLVVMLGGLASSGVVTAATSTREQADLCDAAAYLQVPVLDYEEAARQEGWGWDAPASEWRQNDNGDGFDAISTALDWEDLCMEQCISPCEREIFEHWAVSEWLAEKLEAKGERVDRDFAGLCVWGRTCTGQSIASDDVICQIYDEMMGG